jgi:hypothetical protein
MFNPALITFVGAAPPISVVAANNVPQAEPSPTAPPGESTQVAIISASVLIYSTGTVVPAGTFNPGTVPVDGFA